MEYPAAILLFVTTLTLGLKHGIDWDHLAAITDITGSFQDLKKAFFHATLYAIGHGIVIIVLGLLTILFGISIPPQLDAVMKPIVGITLIILGVWIMYSVSKHKKNFRMKSRWMLLFSLLQKFTKKLFPRLPLNRINIQNFGTKSSFLIGIIHGIGAETPTQIVLFLTATKAGGAVIGISLLVTFVLGLILSNTAISILTLLGYKHSKHYQIYIVLGFLSGILSITIGSLFLINQGSVLPPII